MAKKWNEVLSNPDYQNLSAPDKAAAQAQYFNDVVKPQLPADQVDAAHSQFYSQYPVGASASPAQAPQAQAPTDLADEAANALAGTGRIVAGGVAGIANVGVGIGNAVLSAADWATGGNVSTRIPEAGYGSADAYLKPRGAAEQAGADIITYAAGGEALAPMRAAEAVPAATGYLARLGGSVVRNLEGSAAGSISANNQANDAGSLLSDVAMNTVLGVGLEGVGSGLVKAGSATRRAIMSEGRAADAARETRIGQIADDTAAIHDVLPTLHGKTPEQALSDPQIDAAFRKPGETGAVPERLQTTLKGMYGNESGDAMIRAAERGEAPSTAPHWQNELNANWQQPIDQRLTGTATRRLENEYSSLERSRPEISLQRLDELNQAYRGDGYAPSVVNPSIKLGNLSDRTLNRLGVSEGTERFGLRAGEGAESSLFGLGQLTRDTNQSALNRAANSVESNAGTMAGRKLEGTRLSQQTFDAMKDQHAQLIDNLAPQVEQFQNAVSRQDELVNALHSAKDPSDHLAIMQELNQVSNDIKALKPAADNAQAVIDNSATALRNQAEKAGDQVTIGNAYKNAAKQGDGYVSTRNLTNYGAQQNALAESLTSGRTTRGFDEAESSIQQTPRQIMEAREETSGLRDKQAKGHHTNESKSLNMLHYVTHGATLIPHLISVGFSRIHANAIMDDLARTGGKNLTGDELREVLGSAIDNKAAKTLMRAYAEN